MSNRTKLIFIGIIVLVMLFGLIKTIVYGLDRCQDFIPDIRQSAIQYLGLDFPYYYNVGCAIAETNCRADLVSFDGGKGLYQFTPSTGVLKDIQKYNIVVDPLNPISSIRGQAFYMSLIINKKFKQENITVGKSKYHISPNKYVQVCGNNLADAYRFYNGGYWFFYEAGLKQKGEYVCENREMFKYCVRGGVWVGKGEKKRWLSFCEVNYSYPEKIYKYSQKYNMKLPTTYVFWFQRDKISLSEIENAYAYDDVKLERRIK